MFKYIFSSVLLFLFVISYTPAQMLDDSATRVQTTLKPDFTRIGTVKPRNVGEIESQNWCLGCETLDRDLTDYEAYKEYLVPLGIKEIRLQGGWAKCEKVKGQYDFAWLDKIVDDARGRGLDVCIETSYGNRLYPNSGNLGPSGPLPSGEETLAAWDRWVEALVTHFKERVTKWSMWNEPNLGFRAGQVEDPRTNPPEKTADFNIRTAEIIKRIQPEAEIAGLVTAGHNMQYMEGYLQRLREAEKLDLFTWIVFHTYSPNPDSGTEANRAVWPLLQKYSEKLNPWQGEAGAPSEEVAYALKGIDWSELSQAKWNVRRMLGDLRFDIRSTVFTISDIAYGGVRIQRYGLLKTNTDRRIVKVKIAYYAVQNTVAIFDGTLTRIERFYGSDATCDKPLMVHGYRNKKSGGAIVAYWIKSDPPGDANETIPAQIALQDLKFKEPVWVDLVTGAVYEIPADRVATEDGRTVFKDMPAYDAPVLIAERALVPMVVFKSGGR